MAADRTRRARAARKRKRRLDRVENDLSADQWAALQAAWGGCAYCGESGSALQRDCVLALSRGGRYTLANIVPACRSCNASKCNDEVTGWLRRKRLDERAFLLRHVEISRELVARFDVGTVLHDPNGGPMNTNSPDAAPLPEVIATFQSAHDRRDVATALAQFVDTATVVDDGRTYDGITGVESFLRTAASEFTFTRTLVSAAEVAPDQWIVTNHLEGDFPGGQVDLAYEFHLTDGLIAHLAIAP